MPSLGEYLRRGYEYLSGFFGRRPREEEEEEKEPLEEPEVPPEAKESEEGALIAGEMKTGAKIPTYRTIKMPEAIKFVSETETIISKLGYVTIIDPKLTYCYEGKSEYGPSAALNDPVRVEGIFTGDPVAFIQDKEDFNRPGSYIFGYIVVRVFPTLADGTLGQSIMQKKFDYKRYMPT